MEQNHANSIKKFPATERTPQHQCLVLWHYEAGCTSALMSFKHKLDTSLYLVLEAFLHLLLRRCTSLYITTKKDCSLYILPWRSTPSCCS